MTLLEGKREEKLAAFAGIAQECALARADLIARTAWRDEVVEEAIGAARAAGLVVETGGQLMSPAMLDQLKQTVVKDVQEHHRAEPLSRGLALEVLRGRHFGHAALELFRAVLTELEKDGSVVVEKDIVRRPEHSRAVSGADAALRDRLEAIYREAKWGRMAHDRSRAEP